MTIFKIELIEGPELFYENPFKETILIAASADSLKSANPEKHCFLLRKGESITVKSRYIYVGIGT